MAAAPATSTGGSYDRWRSARRACAAERAGTVASAAGIHHDDRLTGAQQRDSAGGAHRLHVTPRELRAPLVAGEHDTLVLSSVGAPGNVVELILAGGTRVVPRPDLQGVSPVRRRTAKSMILADVVARNARSRARAEIGAHGGRVPVPVGNLPLRRLRAAVVVSPGTG